MSEWLAVRLPPVASPSTRPNLLPPANIRLSEAPPPAPVPTGDGVRLASATASAVRPAVELQPLALPALRAGHPFECGETGNT